MRMILLGVRIKILIRMNTLAHLRQAKKFRYTTTPLKAEPADLVNTPLLGAKAIHFLATPDEIQRQVPELLSLRLRHGFKNRPFIIWEPFPAYCTPHYRQSFIEACKFVDVFSPNHHEMASLFEDEPSMDFSPCVLEQYALEFLPAVRPSTMAAIIIRAGKQGCLAVSSPTKRVWLPAFYDDDSPKVVDPTGAGNAFLGGYMVGFHLTQDVVKASQYGSVTASFALEQTGLPTREDIKDQECWNRVRVVDRLEQYKARLEHAAEL
jgi:sugar/nucleoside kinase (ribokinase family)